MNKINIECTSNNKKIFHKLKRQQKVIEYLCKLDDFYGTTDSTIHKIDQLYHNREREISQNQKLKEKNNNNNNNRSNTQNKRKRKRARRKKELI